MRDEREERGVKPGRGGAGGAAAVQVRYPGPKDQGQQPSMQPTVCSMQTTRHGNAAARFIVIVNHLCTMLHPNPGRLPKTRLMTVEWSFVVGDADAGEGRSGTRRRQSSRHRSCSASS
eukprot:2816264-Rhodomonas_salina.2